PDNIARCLAAGVNVIESDVDDGLKDFGDGSFDYVVMSGALQAMQHPDRVVAEILRVGRTGIVTFPNFGHWRVRLAREPPQPHGPRPARQRRAAPDAQPVVRGGAVPARRAAPQIERGPAGP